MILYSQGLTLRPIDEGDTKNVVEWRNRVKRFLFSQDDVTEEMHLNWLNNYVKKGKCHQFIIEIDENCEKKKSIGSIFIKNIHEDLSEGEYGIFIGEEVARGKGYGRIASELILDYAFNELNLSSVVLYVFSFNESAIHLYENLGFVIQKGYEETKERDGQELQVIKMVLTKKNA